MTDQITLSLAHSPDADDAFMWWALTPDSSGAAPLDTGRFRFEIAMNDIESLNAESNAGRYDITAISSAQFPFVAETYAIATCGASFGLNYGPKLIAREPVTIDEIAASKLRIAVPGLRTTAALLTGMIVRCDSSRFAPIEFDTIIDRVATGEFEFGVVIHEGQLTYQESNLHLICDVGSWWCSQFELPLPLGLNVIRRDLDVRFGAGTLAEIGSILRRSVDYAISHRHDAVTYAMQFARDITSEQADEFVRMYVNELTVDCGEEGRRAIETLLNETAQRGLGPVVTNPHFVSCRSAMVS